MDEPFASALPVDTTGAPVVVQCVMPVCPSLDLEMTECAPGRSWMFTCGAGHAAWIFKAAVL